MIVLDQIPSFHEHRIRFPVRENFLLCNASVTVLNNQIFAAVCCGDHFMNEMGLYMPYPPGEPINRHRFSEQTVYLAHLNPHLGSAKSFAEIMLDPADTPVLDGPTYRGFRGFDSARIFGWDGELWMTMCAMGTGGKPESATFLARIDDGPRYADLRRMKPILPYPTHAEKNWMPEVVGGILRFHYHLGTLIALDGTLTHPGGRADLIQLHGGSQVLPFNGGGLCIAHGFHQRPNTYNRDYQHYFVRTNAAGSPTDISAPFTLRSRKEIVTGMAFHPDGRLMISYGRDGAEETMPDHEFAFIATIDHDDLGRLL